MKVVYSSFDGRYGDSPMALYQQLATGSDREQHVWLSGPRHAAGFPRDAATVTVGSNESLAALESADVIIANTHIDLDFDKKPGAAYLQTWHGTPLKRVHHDVLWAPPGRLSRLDRDVARWDYLLSPNAASTERLRNAFRFPGPVVETGYPRNDILSSPLAALIRARVRAQLGLDEETLAVLYAPTWRDDQYFVDDVQPVDLALDVAAMVAQVGTQGRVLARLHPLMTERSRLVQHDGVQDVSHHPNITELYLAADVLITDYSSVMFDFAITGKPMIFYGYDLESYRDELRGFYFDLEPVAPGPLVRTTGEVLDALRQLAGIRSQYAGRYAAFRQQFCHLEDGHAGDRVIQLLERVRRSANGTREEPQHQEPAALLTVD